MTVRLDPFGTERGPVNNVVNLGVVKEFRLTQSRRFAIEINCYNVLNSNAATATSSGPNPGSAAINYASGPTYGYVTAILPPRIVRLGAKFSLWPRCGSRECWSGTMAKLLGVQPRRPLSQ